jgi:hypothetical protein
MYSDSNILQEFQKQTRNVLPPNAHHQPTLLQPQHHHPAENTHYHQLPQQQQQQPLQHHQQNFNQHITNTTSSFQNPNFVQHQHQQQPIRGVSNSLSMRKLNEGVQSVLGTHGKNKMKKNSSRVFQNSNSIKIIENLSSATFSV